MAVQVATTLVALFLTCALAQPEAPTESPADRSKENYEKALAAAKDAMDALDEKVANLNTTLHDRSKIAAIYDKILADAGREVPTRDDCRTAREEERTRKHHIRDLGRTAKKAAKEALHFAKKDEKVQKHAGMPEHGSDGFETNFGHREHANEHAETLAEHTAERGEKYVEQIYRMVGERLDKEAEAAEAAEKSTPASASEAASAPVPAHAARATALALSSAAEPSQSVGDFESNRLYQAAAIVAVCVSFVSLAAAAYFHHHGRNTQDASLNQFLLA